MAQIDQVCCHDSITQYSKCVHIRLGKCGKCIKLGEIIKSNANTATKKKAQYERKDHIDLCNAERAYYHRRIAYSRLNPAAAISMIIDGSSPVCTLSVVCNSICSLLIKVVFPWIFPIPKEYLKSHRFKLRINGIINHGLDFRTLWLHSGCWGKGPNLTCSLLLHHLMEAEAMQGTLPPTLYLQVYTPLYMVALPIFAFRWIIVLERIRISMCFLFYVGWFI